MRTSGIILPVFSLPSDYGIGTFGKEAFKFVDFLVEAKQTFWQILPLGPTSYGDSPYQSFSTFAGNPYFIDLELLIKEGLLEKESVEKLGYGDYPSDIDYGRMYERRYIILREAYDNGNIRYGKEVEKFKKLNKDWIEDYALFMALKDHFGGRSWREWDLDIKLRKPEAVEKYTEKLEGDIKFYTFLQFLFYKQWTELKAYANDKGIRIIGDIPIYVAEDSADVWTNPEFFQLDEELNPVQVAGCPPDAFSADGQLWGNPVYNWEALEADGFKWWIERVRASLKIFDVIRIDHFRGFASYWSVPYGHTTAVHGEWIEGPGIKVFKAINEALGHIDIIAEDLGFLTDDVRQLLKDTGYPGMKVLEFAFDPSGKSEYLPHHYIKNAVAYTGTHDNDTIKGWFNSLSDEEAEFCKAYTGMKNEDDNWMFIRTILASPANMAIMQMQDLLNLGSEARINIPSTLGTNWRWRMTKEDMRKDLAERLAELTRIYDRCNR